MTMPLLQNVTAENNITTKVEHGTLFCDDVSVWVVPILALVFFSWISSECVGPPFIFPLFSVCEHPPKFHKH